MTHPLSASALAAAAPLALVERAAFADALTRICKTVDRRATVPILGNVYIAGSGEAITVTGTDLDTWHSVTIPAAAGADLGITVPAHAMRDLVKAYAGDTVVLRADGDGLAIVCGMSSAKLQTKPASDYPDPKLPHFTHAFSAPRAELLRALDSVAFAMSTEEARFYLNGVYMHRASRWQDGRDYLRFVATDGHRLALAEIPAPEGTEGLAGCILPTKLVLTLLSELKRKGTPDSVGIEVSANRSEAGKHLVPGVRVTIGTTMIVAKTVDGTYPDYCRVIPQRNPITARVDTKPLQAAIKAVTKAADCRGRAARWDLASTSGEVAPGRLEISLHNPDLGRVAHTVMLDRLDSSESCIGPEITLGLNCGYVLDILAASREAALDISFSDPSGPVLFRPVECAADGVAWLAVQMPMRVMR